LLNDKKEADNFLNFGKIGIEGLLEVNMIKRLMTLGILLAVLSIGITAYALVSLGNPWSTHSDWGAAVDGGYLNNYFVQFITESIKQFTFSL
jgi:hypothetical protein